MNRPTRLTALLAAVAAPAALATAVLAAPAAAAAPYPGCTEPIDGAVVCYVASKSPTNQESMAEVSFPEAGRTFTAVLVALEACDANEVCVPVAARAGNGVPGISTGPVPHDFAVDHYRANASWVDDQGHLHSGVTAQYP